ncbi:hypothetical protein CC79DRAFT_1317295 [Sarocladium strictum]
MASNTYTGKHDLRMLVLGHGAHLLAVRVALGAFHDEYDPTEGTWRVQKIIQNNFLMYDITDWTDLSSLQANPELLKSHLENAHVLISVLEPTRPESNEKLESFRFGDLMPLFEKRKQTRTIEEGVIVLWREEEMNSTSRDSEQWKAGTARGEDYAEKAGAHGPFLAYAESGMGVEEAFEQMAIKVVEMWRHTEGEARVAALSVEAARAARFNHQVQAQSSVWERLWNWICKRKHSE